MSFLDLSIPQNSRTDFVQWFLEILQAQQGVRRVGECDEVEVTADLIAAFLPTTALPLGQRNTDIK